MNNEKYKILITGATSKVAEALVRFARMETNHELVLLSSHADLFPQTDGIKVEQCSLMDVKSLKNICYSERPDFIINTAAVTDVLTCENDKKTAWDINATVPETLASITRVLDCHLIQISCDYVFDGKKGPYDEVAKPDPVNYCGRTKHAGENSCLVNLNNFTIVRTCFVYGFSSYGREDYIRNLITKFKKEKVVKAADGQFMNPTFSDDIARAIFKIIDKRRKGIFHLGGADWLSRLDIGKITALVFDLDIDKIQPVHMSAIPKSIYPEKGGLITLKAQTDLGIKFSGLESGLITLKQQMLEMMKYSFIK